MQAYRIFFTDIVGTMGARLVALVVLMVLVGLTEGLTMAMLLPLLARIGIAAGSASGDFARALESSLSLLGDQVGAGTVLLVLLGIAVVHGGLLILLSWTIAAATRRYEADWQVRLFRSFISARWLFLTKHEAGRLTNAIVTECTRLAGAFMSMAQLFAASIVALIYLVISLLISAKVTLCLLGVAFLLAVSFARLYRTTYHIGNSITPLNAKLQTLAGEYLAGAKIVKTTANEGRSIQQVESVVRRLESAKRMANFLPPMVRALFELGAVAALVSLLVFGANALEVTPANVLVVLALFARLVPRFSNLQTYIHSLNSFVPAIVVLSDLVRNARDNAEVTDGTTKQLTVPAPAALAVSNLTVRFDDRRVLDNVNLAIPVPGTAGIVGGSGAGKSTLIHAVLGLVACESGRLSLGSYDFKDVNLATWRRSIGYVPQETILFNTTIRENILMGRPEASDDELMSALRQAHCEGFVAALPNGLETKIGDQGVLLSGGQRQRLGIARALLSNPVVLLMDEPTSSLDPESEQEILAALGDLSKHMGIAIVAHRLATVRNADCIYFLEHGRVVEQGRWDALIERGARFSDFAHAQHMA